MSWTPKLTEHERAIVDHLKGCKPSILFSGRGSGKRWLASIAVSEFAKEHGGIDLYDATTKQTYHVPPGTPPHEALPVPIKDDPPNETHQISQR